MLTKITCVLLLKIALDHKRNRLKRLRKGSRAYNKFMKVTL